MCPESGGSELLVELRSHLILRQSFTQGLGARWTHVPTGSHGKNADLIWDPRECDDKEHDRIHDPNGCHDVNEVATMRAGLWSMCGR